MNDSLALHIPKLETVRIELPQPDLIKLAGAVKDRDTIAELSAFFRVVHGHALSGELLSLQVDVSELTFVSAAGLRLFLDWATWLKGEKRHPYRLRFLTSRLIGWQKTSLPVLAGLAKDLMEVQRID